MPTRPPSPCTVCGELTQRGRCQYCTRRAERRRGKTTERGYDQAWEDLRAWHLARNPLCVECGKLGDTVDHIESVKDAPHRRLDPTNLRTYCAPHHNARTWRDQGPGSLPTG